MIKPLKAVAFLQNAWSPKYAGRTWPRRSWLHALKRSHSGRRLSVFEANCAGIDIYYTNTTPIVGAKSNSIVKADKGYVVATLENQKPDYVIGFGKQAGKILKELVTNTPLMLLPHPACRSLTNVKYIAAGLLLEIGFSGILDLSKDYT